ncbi:MAG: twin-arginine translocase subunit TatB [Nitrospirae bacterium]|nr:twin-arginine translocase subunit TatB [Nitrospirota bacterium]
MFDIGIQELIIIFVIALIVFGPEKLPEISRKLGRFVIQVRKGVNEARFQMENEFKEAELKMEDDVSNLVKKVDADAPDKEVPADKKQEKE